VDPKVRTKRAGLVFFVPHDQLRDDRIRGTARWRTEALGAAIAALAEAWAEAVTTMTTAARREATVARRRAALARVPRSPRSTSS
jgi:hypothetical protein